ncbi:Flp family type IVb pilin [Rhodoblastus sp. 17X3]|uniref:Flp family type IVb pilin n=1 Tax=Rhodoblastus sp. 17X3 TaxID=3047026 RepID=UPI0024B7F6D6|nr:Flp family type IVb pilin [Rhodoblastus sp. 17X3]MDI9848845.1 Flp family type IVb pilin [Rhodoblastus sp. 17X3]
MTPAGLVLNIQLTTCDRAAVGLSFNPSGKDFVMRNLLQKFRRDEDGAAMVEYAVLLGLITAAVIATITLLGGDIAGIFSTVEAAIKAVPGA